MQKRNRKEQFENIDLPTSPFVQYLNIHFLIVKTSYFDLVNGRIRNLGSPDNGADKFALSYRGFLFFTLMYTVAYNEIEAAVRTV
jgi:hypothetical protein